MSCYIVMSISHIMCYVSCHVTCYVSSHKSWHKSCNVKYLATHTLLIVLNNYLTNLTILSNVIYQCHKSCTHVTCHVSCIHVTCHVSMSHVMYSISFFKSEYWITLDNMRYYKCLLINGKNHGFPSKYRCLGLIDRMMLETWNFFWWLRTSKCPQKTSETQQFLTCWFSGTP